MELGLTNIKQKLCQGGEFVLYGAAKSGLAGILFGRVICQLSGAQPALFTSSYHALNAVKITDAILCKIMLAYGPASATKKAIALDLSLVSGALVYHNIIPLLYGQEGAALRDLAYENLATIASVEQTALLVALFTGLMVSADWLDVPPFKWGRNACIEAMNLRAKEIPDLPVQAAT